MTTIKEFYVAISNNNAGQMFVDIRRKEEKDIPTSKKLYKTVETSDFRKVDGKAQKVTIVKEYFYDEDDAHIDFLKNELNIA